MLQKYRHLLERLGLSENERDIYLTLLEYPYLTVTDISKRTGSHRPMIYRGLASLEADELVDKSYLDGKRYYYHTTSPTKLREKLERLNTIADNTIPELEQMYQKTSNAPILSVKEGVSGIQSIHRDLVESVPKGGIYFRYSSSKVEYPGNSIYTPENYKELREKKSLERVTLTSEIQKKRRSGDPNNTVIAIPKEFDTFDDNITKLIYANKVAIIDYDSQIGWVIESDRFARYEEKIFRLLTKLLEQKTQKI